MIGSASSGKQERSRQAKCEFGFGCQIHFLTWPGQGGGDANNGAGTSYYGCTSSSTGYSSKNGAGCSYPACDLG